MKTTVKDFQDSLRHCTGREKILKFTCQFERRCYACLELIHFVRTNKGALHPFNADGVTHFATCASLPVHQRLKHVLPEIESEEQLELFMKAPNTFKD